MAITKPTTSGFPDLKVVKKNEQINLTLGENYEHLYTDQFTVAVGETYFSEALHGTEDTALFLWADDVLLLNGKNKIKYTNNTAAPMNIQLVVKLFDETNENGKMMPSGSYAMYKGDTTFSDGETELPVPPVTKLCVNSRIYARDAVGEVFTDEKFGYALFVENDSIFAFSKSSIYKYTTEGVYVTQFKMPSGNTDYERHIDVSLDSDGNGFVVVGAESYDGSGSGYSTNQGAVVLFDQDLNLISQIENPNMRDGLSYDLFGSAVSVSHEGTLAVIAGLEEGNVQGSGSGTVYNSGALYIYDIRNPMAISLTHSIDLSNEFGILYNLGYSTEVDVRGFGPTGTIVLSNLKTEQQAG